MAEPGGEAAPWPGPPVQIRVAIQEAEDEERTADGERLRDGERRVGSPARFLSPGWGSGGEDEAGRGRR